MALIIKNIMNKNLHIFTIAVGCTPVVIKMLESYFKYHNQVIHLYTTVKDHEEIIKNVSLKNLRVHFVSSAYAAYFKQGHLGTATILANVIKSNPDSYLIHIDSDIIFKQESLSLIEKAGYPDLYGSIRCYKNNPGKAPVPEGVEDAISTYFMGFNPEYTKDLSREDLVLMCQGVKNPLGFPCLDFFDPVYFYCRSKGASVYYGSYLDIGGQSSTEEIKGTKIGPYHSNLHFDCGSHLIHFGGVGSGYMATIDDSGMNKSYSDWARERWRLFCDLFYPGRMSAAMPEFTKTVYDESGRWVSGSYDEEIFDQLQQDLELF